MYTMYQPKPKDDKSMNLPVSVKEDDSKGTVPKKKEVTQQPSEDTETKWETNTLEDDDSEW